ncbi:MAG: glutathione S-transferase family protein [Bdellovibrionota bacterium]
MKLYYAPRSRATRPRWLLEELEVPYEIVRLDMKAKDHKKPEYMEIHPHGAVPAFEDGNLKMFESAAICLYLADKFPEKKLAPAIGSADRGKYYQWMIYAMATLEPPVIQIANHLLMLPPEKRSPAAVEEGKQKLAVCLKVLRKALDGKEYLLGNFSAADVMIGSILGWGKAMGLLEGHPEIGAYVSRCTSRPAFKKANAD